MKKLISLEVETEVIQKIKEYAKMEDRSFSSIIRRILAEYINNHEKEIKSR